MGATPAWCDVVAVVAAAATMRGSMPSSTGFSRWRRHDVALVGGDTTRGPLSVCVTVHGSSRPGTCCGAMRRRSATTCGSAGRSAMRRLRWCNGARRRGDRGRRCANDWIGRCRACALGLALVAIANAAIDVSDGVLADLAHVCAASGVGAEVDVDALPASEALRSMFEGDARRHVQATGGDDYELCFTAPRVVARCGGGCGARCTASR